MFLECDREFKFHIDDSDAVFGAESISSIKDPKIKSWVESAYMRWKEQEKRYEREWRKYELEHTDWMLIPDATFAGAPLAGSDKLEEVKNYRNELRSYDLTKTNRPTKPEWL